MDQALIEFREVSKAFGQRVVLDRANVSIYPSEVTTILGKSGVGKSVTLKLIMGLLQPDQGRILYKGKDLSRMNRKERAAMKHEVAFMFQSNALFDSLNIFDNIALPLREKTRLSAADISAKVSEKIDFLELSGHENKFPAEVSGGMQKRVALARALVSQPSVVLFDEPTTGLDPVRKISVLAMIVENQKQFGFSGVLVSHDVPDVFYVSNRIILLDEGKILFQGSPMELEHHPHQVVREFLDSLLKLENKVIGLKSEQELEQLFASSPAETVHTRQLSVCVLTLKNLSALQDALGEVTVHRILALIASLMGKELERLGGRIGRKNHNSLIGLMPQTGYEFDPLLEKIQKAVQSLGFLRQEPSSAGCARLTLLFGCTQSSGRSSFDVQKMGDEAMTKQFPFLEMECLNWFSQGQQGP